MGLEQHGHQFNENGPGSVWQPSPESRIIHPEHSTVVGELLSDEHFDVYVRYGYARALTSGSTDEEFTFWKGLYEKMQTERVGVARTNQFDMLIANVEKNGLASTPIPVDERYGLLDGSHRLALSAVYDARPVVAVYDTPSHSYDEKWFVEKGFAQEEIQEIQKVRSELQAKYSSSKPDTYIAIVWGVALDYWEEIVHTLNAKQLRRAFIKDFKGEIQHFIMDSYNNDGMQADRIRDKSARLSAESSKVGILAIDDNPEQVNAFKKNIRAQISKKMDNYFFDNIIHVVDDQAEGQALLQKHDIKN
ncbi:MAG: hypothetical protein WCT27_03465 [Patescibacteria group bacterium]